MRIMMRRSVRIGEVRRRRLEEKGTELGRSGGVEEFDDET